VRHTPPKLSTSAHLHRVAGTPPLPWSNTSLPAPLEGDLPAFPTRSTFARAAPGHGHLPGPSMHVEPHQSKQAASTPSAAVEPHAPTTTAATDEDAAEALRGEVAGAGGNDHVDAPVERALVDGRLDAIETTRNRWCPPTVEVDLLPCLTSTSTIGFSW
jgi:hypothetical protein